MRRSPASRQAIIDTVTVVFAAFLSTRPVWPSVAFNHRLRGMLIAAFAAMPAVNGQRAVDFGDAFTLADAVVHGATVAFERRAIDFDLSELLYVMGEIGIEP